jgi:tetratricopeptide (TPR) repeat protein
MDLTQALNLFHVGDYAKALSSFQQLKSTAAGPADQLELTAYAVRCLLALGKHREAHQLAQQQLQQPSGNAPSLQFLSLLADYRQLLQGDAPQMELAKQAQTMREWIGAQPRLGDALQAATTGAATGSSRSPSPVPYSQAEMMLAAVVAAWLLEDSQSVEEAMRIVAPIADRDAEWYVL